MNQQRAIRDWCGIQVMPSPEDGKLRSFKIDALRNGFAIAYAGCWAFGSIIDGIVIIYDGRECLELAYEHKRSPKISFEWLVWEAGRACIEDGIVMTQEDSERLALAVRRLEGWL